MDTAAKEPLFQETPHESSTTIEHLQDKDVAEAREGQACSSENIVEADKTSRDCQSSDARKRTNSSLEEPETDGPQKKRCVDRQVPALEANYQPRFLIKVKNLILAYTKEDLAEIFLPNRAVGMVYFIPTALYSKYYAAVLCFEEKEDAEKANNLLLNEPAQFFERSVRNPERSVKWTLGPQEIATQTSRDEGDICYEAAVMRTKSVFFSSMSKIIQVD